MHGDGFVARSNSTQTTMKTLVLRLVGRASDLAQTQPLLALCLGAALFAVFISLLLRKSAANEEEPRCSGRCTRNWSSSVRDGCGASPRANDGVLRTYLRKSVAHFQQTHGRVTTANYNAVQTIWGSEQTQRKLTLHVYYEEEVAERTEFRRIQPSRRSFARKRSPSCRRQPFSSRPRMNITLKQNARKKGSALYGGYETACRFTWKAPESRQPGNEGQRFGFRSPPRARCTMTSCDRPTAWTCCRNGIERCRARPDAVDLGTNEELNVVISFRSRGMSQWYFPGPGTARDARLHAHAEFCPTCRKRKLNYPEGCMSPTDVKPTADGRGSMLT